jgi:O-antigen ligase|tara:strand:+ start:6687 stop:7925 length:1239 start_codon:yes stop_codon:yes gene_type:complete
MRILLTAIYPYVFILLYLIIPFDEYVRALPNILMAILVIAFPFLITKNDFKKLLKKPTLLLVSFIVFLLANSLFQGRFEQDFGYIKTMIIPIGIVILYLPIADFKKLKKAIIFSSFIAMVYTFIQFLILINQNSEVTIAFFQETVDALLIDRIYVGLLCVLSILISYRSLTKEYHPDNKYYFVSIIVNILYLLLVMSITALVILFVLIVLRQFYGKDKKLRLLITSVVLIAIFITGHLKYQSAFEDLLQESRDVFKVTYTESTLPLGYRAVIWDCVSKISDEGSIGLFGIGFKETKNRLLSCYNSEIEDNATKQNFINKRFNTHNQYIDFYISAGPISLLLFIGILLFLFIKNQKKYFPTALLITFVLFGLAENYFHRQVGAYYVGFILVILLINNTALTSSELKESNTDNS